MARETLAPWAEHVPGRGRMTADELLALPDDGWRYELMDGVLVKMPPPGFEHGVLSMLLGSQLALHVRRNALGVVTGAETGYLLSRPGEQDTVLAPDVAFVRAEHVPPPGTPDVKKHLREAPDLVAEIASPDQYKPELADKARVYLAAGVRLVWVVWPASKTIDVWRQGSDSPVTLAVSDSLDGSEVVPGFIYPLAELFA